MTTTWMELLLGAMESNSHVKPSSLFQLSTLGLNGSPSNRTVVFRGFEDNTNRIQIHTDHRSCKDQELKNRPVAEICWYFADSWEQLRINGTVEIIDGSNPDRQRLQSAPKWCGVGDDGRTQGKELLLLTELRINQYRMQYLGPAPGLPHLMETEHSFIQNSLDPEAGPVGAFCLLVFDPDEIDYQNLKSNSRLEFHI